MKRYYILITAESIIDHTSVFYKIAIGSSAAGHHDLQFLQAFAAQRGYYFALYSHEVAAFIIRIAKSLEMKVCDLPFKVVDGHELVSQLKSSKNVAENHLTIKRNRVICHRQSTRFHQLSDFSVIHHAEAPQRIKPKVLR